MTTEIKFYLSILGIIIGIVCYYPYFRDIYNGKTKPHAFSWLIFGVLSTIAFVIQLYEDGGLGSWTLGTSAILCSTVSIIGFYQKQISYSKLDWFSLLLATIAIGLWMITNDPTYSVLLVSLTSFIGYIPTYRKIYYKPHSETLSTWYMMNIRIIIGTLALTTYSFNTTFFTLLGFIFNGISIAMIHRRKTDLKKLEKEQIQLVS